MKRSSYASPYAIWMVMFTLVPLLFVVYFAFTGRDGSFTLRNFEKFFQPMYLSALVLSLKLAFFCIPRPSSWPAGIFRGGNRSWCCFCSPCG